MTSYAFDNAAVAESSQRFRSLEACYDPVTRRGLAETGVGPGWECLEVGAGTGSIARVTGAIHALLAEAGADPAWGSHAYQAVVDTGFVDVQVRGFSEAWQGGSVGAHLHRANLQQTATRLVSRGLVSEADVAAFLDLLEDPHFTMSSYLMLTTRGRRGPDVR